MRRAEALSDASELAQVLDLLAELHYVRGELADCQRVCAWLVYQTLSKRWLRLLEQSDRVEDVVKPLFAMYAPLLGIEEPPDGALRRRGGSAPRSVALCSGSRRVHVCVRARWRAAAPSTNLVAVLGAERVVRHALTFVGTLVAAQDARSDEKRALVASVALAVLVCVPDVPEDARHTLHAVAAGARAAARAAAAAWV